MPHDIPDPAGDQTGIWQGTTPYQVVTAGETAFLEHQKGERMPEQLSEKAVNRIMENAFASKESLLRRVTELERVIVQARREFRSGGDPVDARAWLFRVEIDEDRYTD